MAKRKYKGYLTVDLTEEIIEKCPEELATFLGKFLPSIEVEYLCNSVFTPGRSYGEPGDCYEDDSEYDIKIEDIQLNAVGVSKDDYPELYEMATSRLENLTEDDFDMEDDNE
jgi:hypothetical protein